MTNPSPPNLVAKRFDFDGTFSGYFEGGKPGALPLLVMHGIGPGASVSSAFASIFGFLCDHFHVFAMDFLGFGSSGKKAAPPYFDFATWVRQAEALVSLMPQGDFGIFGHSLSGAVALRLASRNKRVKSVITTGTAGAAFKVPRDLEQLWTFPHSRDDLFRTFRSLVFDADKIPDAELDRRWAILGAPGYGDYYDKMFEGGLEQKQKLIDQAILLDSELAAIRIPVTLVHGRDDYACRWEDTSLPLAQKIANSDLVILSRCGHAPSMEHPGKVIACVKSAFSIAQ